jgi:hypothetical protein
MKRTLFVLPLLFVPIVANPQAAGAPLAPNVFNLSGGKMHITYSTSVNGEARMAYQDGAQTSNFGGNQIRQTKTELGTLVSVTTHMTVDSGSTCFTLVVPTVKLANSSGASTVHTVGITTVHRFSVVPMANRGQTELYTVTQLSGSALHREF